MLAKSLERLYHIVSVSDISPADGNISAYLLVLWPAEEDAPQETIVVHHLGINGQIGQMWLW